MIEENGTSLALYIPDADEDSRGLYNRLLANPILNYLFRLNSDNDDFGGSLDANHYPFYNSGEVPDGARN